MSMQLPNSIALPAGWSIPTWRETSQANAAGIIVQGINFSLSSPQQQITSVFVPNSLLGSTQAIQDAFMERIHAITAITG